MLRLSVTAILGMVLWATPLFAEPERPAALCLKGYATLIEHFGNNLVLTGEGSFAAVYLTKDTPVPMAIKVPLGEEPRGRQSLQHEVAVSKLIEPVDPDGLFMRAHPGPEGMLILTTMLYDGESPKSVKAVVRGGETGAFDADHIAAQLGKAQGILQKTGENGWVHSDITPANLLIDSTGKILVVDFGLVAPVGGYAPYLGKLRLGAPPYAPWRQERLNLPADPSDDARPIGMIIDHFKNPRRSLSNVRRE